MSSPISGDNLEPLISKLEMRGHFSVADRQALLALPATIKTADAGEYLIWEGAQNEHCTVLLRGFVQRHKVVPSGGRQIVGIQMDGDILDLQSLTGLMADCSAQTLTRARIALVPVEPLAALLKQRPSIGRALWAESLTDASVFREWLVNIGRRDARTRMAHLLCELALRQERAHVSERARFELPLTQEQLGDVLGLTSVHVNRMLKGLSQEGLISYRRGKMRVLDWDGLKAAGEFDDSYLHFKQRQNAWLE